MINEIADKGVQIEADNLSYAWGEGLVHLIENPGVQRSPFLISVNNSDEEFPDEDPQIRNHLDRYLDSIDKQSVLTVANTIFPKSLWNPNRPRSEFYSQYEDIHHKLKKCPKNEKGHYFNRLIRFDSEGEQNQLEELISNWEIGSRRSALQASIFDPNRDHSSAAQQGFPCLQQISFSYLTSHKDSLAINAFYATQYYIERAYGNFLGLCRLGQFVASAIDKKIEQMNCFVGIQQIQGDITKQELKDLVSTVESSIGDH